MSSHVVVIDSPLRERCCESHSKACEPAELCCDQCTELDHPDHMATGSWCVLDAPPDLVDEITVMLAAVERNYERERSGPGSRFEGQRLQFAQARTVIRRVFEYVRTEQGRP